MVYIGYNVVNYKIFTYRYEVSYMKENGNQFSKKFLFVFSCIAVFMYIAAFLFAILTHDRSLLISNNNG